MRTPLTLVGVVKANNGKESAMEVRLESTEGPRVAPPSETIDHFAQQTHLRQMQWAEHLTNTPDAFAEIEQEIDQHFRRGAGQLTAALLAKATAQPTMNKQFDQIRRQAAVPLQSPEPRRLRVRLLCGLMLFITTGYCAPRRKKQNDSQERQAGLYPELAALGFGKGCSPALQYTVARIVALNPSIALARKELARQGIVLDAKTVRRIAEQLGGRLLELRRRELFAWRIGELPAGDEFAGCRVAVQIDGGRMRLRENKRKRRSRKKGKRGKFATPWREPKVLTIFEIDKDGKMTKKHRQPLIDGTLLGPDHLAELLAYHLHRLGVAKAELVVFASDGARWIWDRLDWIERRAGLDPSRTVHVLDFCHAAHHISLALKALGMAETQRHEVYRRFRKLLQRSRYDQVVEELKRLSHDQPEDGAVRTEIRYLENHGQAGHLNYATFRRRGIPRGSGAIESTIRRVINQRLKSNAMYWLQENAEAMFAVRATLLCDRWEETLKRVRHTMAHDRRLNWRWNAPDTSSNLNANLDVQPPQSQHFTTQQSTTIAA
jgi:hypothetical protein